MATLVLDTATDALTVAIGQAGELVASSTFCIPRGHSRILQPAIWQIVQQAGMNMLQLSEIGVGVGPGSYTGIRLGVSTAKAMASALCIPLFPIPTLATIAEAAASNWKTGSEFLLPLLSARRGRAFGALYQRTSQQLVCLLDSRVMPVADWLDAAVAQGVDIKNLRVIHNFSSQESVLDTLPTWPMAEIVPLRSIVPKLGAALLTLVGSGTFASCVGDAVHDVAPTYALEVQAEVKLRERRQRDL